jgi:predicted nucleic acid binding AN1-type Zn finger protein
MKTILRSELIKTIEIFHYAGYACPRCKLETWATENRNEDVNKGYCYACAYTGKPLKIIENMEEGNR